MHYSEILDALAQRYQEILGANFTGLYVHGSLAMGCFHPQKSDIDYVCVVFEEPGDEQKMRIMEATLALDRYAPEKGLEMHVMRLEDCLHPSRPCYFCLHYSRAHTQSFLDDPSGYVRRMKGGDPDLGGHLTVLHACGICWSGAPVKDVFAPVPKEMYLESILDDVLSDCGDEIYRICNLCRVWGYLAQGELFSKRTGPQWALRQGEGPREAIAQALRCYEEGEAWGGTLCAEEACAWLKAKILSLLPEEFQKKYAR
ncbi:MAG: DUF4111 domain-containing protein [Eubacteriales bacterium]|nr:DUF4111 domain-containing protein [Eubacteriales bacterium]